MSAGTKLAGGVVVLAIAVGAVAWLRSGDPQAGEIAAPAADRTPVEPALVELGDETEARQAVTEASSGTATVDVLEPEPAPTVSSAGEPIRLVGRVLDVDGLPLAGIGVKVENEPDSGQSDGEGRFELDWSRDRLPVRLVLDDERFAGLREAYVRRGAEGREHLIVAAPAARLRGLVVDDGGRPFADVDVSLAQDGTRLLDFPFVLDTTARVHATTDTGPDGRFELERAPVLPGCQLVARKEGYETAYVTLEPPFTYEPTIELQPAPGRADEPLATGVVLLPDRTPAAGATVRYGSSDTTTDAYGRFELPLAWRPEPDQTARGRARRLRHRDRRTLRRAAGAERPVRAAAGHARLARRDRRVQRSGRRRRLAPRSRVGRSSSSSARG